MRTYSILLADNQVLIRSGLKHLMSGIDDFELIGEAEDRKELLIKMVEHQPDILIMDHQLPGCFSLEDVAEVKKFAPHTNILIISNNLAKESIFKTIEYGINSYLTKECGEKEIIDAIYATGKGEKFFCNKVLDVILHKHVARESSNCDPSLLTNRELELVKLIGQGMSTAQIAKKLFLSQHTIYTHRKNIMKKLQINSASELILYAVNEGLV